ncbi:Ig-like domain-containing protein [Cellulomonas endophytica]|uniref:Ig-like domain-containing protein n=1 Tax=Cellulomonas endophytica TaxID=2494735 RepID=UPI001013AB60|nr:Ig-like domain-containing protein [Cellulomonas endophytica]
MGQHVRTREARLRGPRLPGRRRRSVTGAATVLALVGGALGLVAAPVAQATTGTALLEDGFRNATTVAQSYRVGGTSMGAPRAACLTAGTSTSQVPVPGCPGGPLDADGSGALRITPAANNSNGFLLYDKALPTKAGLDITFMQYQYGGTQADGISFFLTDGAYSLTQAGAYGGSLGYHHQTSVNGVAHGLLGIGFDVFGNYTVETNDPACGTAFRGSSPTNHKSTVAVRGPGDGRAGYCLLGPAVSTVGAGAGSLFGGASTTRPAGIPTRIVIDPPSQPSPSVKVYLGGVLVTTVPQPSALATTPTFKFGWGASTGGQNDVHEINFLDVKSVQPILADLRLAAAATPVASDDSATLTWTPRTDPASGPVPAGEAVTLTSTAPAGVEYGTPVAAGGWDCSASTATTASCTRTQGTRVDPGTTLPGVQVPVSRTAAGTSGTTAVVATVTSASDDPTLATDNTVSTDVRWNPVVRAVSAGTVDATGTPVPATVAADGTGSDLVYSVVTAPDAAVGTASVVGGDLVLTPLAGASGVLQAGYRATDDEGGTSNTATATLVVRPTTADGAGETVSGDPVTVTLPAPVGSGPWTVASVTADHGGAASVPRADGTAVGVRLAPAAGFSGTERVTYRLADRSGLLTDPQEVVVTVRPEAGADSVATDLDAAGGATLVHTLPAPTGTGPFTWALVGGATLDGAQATLTSAGELTLVAATGRSGVHDVRYTVTDASGTVSPELHATVTVRPYLSPYAPQETPADTAVRTPAAVLVGTPATSFSVTPPAGTSAAVAADGAVTFDPQGRSGTFAVLVTGTADGVATSRTLTVTVTPVAADVAGATTASATPAQVRLPPAAPVGTGPFTATLTEVPAADRATVALDGDDLLVTPAPGTSGTVTVRWTVTDAAGGTSEPATATLDVHPATDDATGALRSGTTADVVLPAPLGDGPFVWEVLSVTPPAAATAEPVTGAAALRVAAASTFSGTLLVAFRVADAAGLTSDPAELTVVVDPAAPASGTPTTAGEPGVPGQPVQGPAPQPAGSGPFTFELVPGLDPAVGTATIDPTTGVLTFTPAPGTSGPVDVRYRAVDVHGTASDPAAVTFVVAPLPATGGGTTTGTPAAPARTRAGVPRTLALASPVGSGPFTFEVVEGPAPEQGSLTLDPATGEVTFVPAAGWSGTAAFRYRVLDGSGTPSADSPLVFEVAPVAGPASAEVREGESVTLTLPAPTGTGPFTWDLVGTPAADRGATALDATTGALTFTAAAGTTGTVEVVYAVTDADGVVSDPATATISVSAVAPTVVAAPTPPTAPLAATGAEAAVTAGAAMALLLVGGGLVALRHRRRPTEG